ncbi:MAG TPA: S46 family peptidase [Bacteroidetes bacterium]|nr:S46 family peptidase [Bacteroidota bacterium]
MKKFFAFVTILVSFVLLSSHTNRKMEEGMFPLSEMKNINLQQIGLKMAPQDLYNPNGTSLIDAIVRVGGCTGSFLSNDGLIVTNHHCAFGFVTAISTPQHNYMKEGFLAKTRGEERLAQGLLCKITASYEDVSVKVLAGTESIADPNERLQRIATNIKNITTAENKANIDLQCEISEMFTGRTYVLFRYKLLKDVRLVYVPARSIGEYGGELDNWVWPRHSGDFAFLRAYVAPDGSAAEYSEKNIPYKPAKFLKVNPKGVKENDFVFVLGYPGRTYRHQPAKFFEYHDAFYLKYISEMYDWQINKMEEMSKGNDSLEIRYAGRMKSLANTTKNFKGKLQGFRRAGLTKQKAEDEKQLEQFIAADPTLRNKYSEVIPRINTIYGEIIANAPRNLWYDFVYSTVPALQFAATIDNYADAYNELKTDSEKDAFILKQKPRIEQMLSRYLSSYDKPLEHAALINMLEQAQGLDAQNRIQTIDAMMDKKINFIKFTDELFTKSIFCSPEKVKALYEKDVKKLFAIKDPMKTFASSLNQEMNPDDEKDRKRESELNLLMAKYVDAKSIWKQKQFIPDANGTLRFTYGSVKGYTPNDGEYNKPFTTLTGVIEKESAEFELLAVIKELHKTRDYGSFMHPDLNDLPVNILYNLDTTGGNSGSPVMNAYGDLIGVNFDRAYTATINDYAWNETYSRSVAVDIRYVLWVLQKVAKADNLLKEMNVN